MRGGSLARLSSISSLELVVRRGWSPLLGKLSVVDRRRGKSSVDAAGAKSSKPPASKLDIVFLGWLSSRGGCSSYRALELGSNCSGGSVVLEAMASCATLGRRSLGGRLIRSTKLRLK